MRLSLRAIQHESGKKNPVFLAGHSLGGLFTAVYSALSPADVAGLILIGTPLSFAGRKDAFSPHIAQIPRNRLPIASLGNVAGSVLDMLAASAAPGTFAFARQRDFLASMWSHEALETHLRVQRWSLDERPLAGRLFHETVEWLYGEDRLMSGSLKIGRRCIHPKTVTAPLLVVLERDSEVAPPESMLPFYHATSSSQKQIFWYEGDIGVALQHVGPLVGKSAHAMLWGKITDWIHRNA